MGRRLGIFKGPVVVCVPPRAPAMHAETGLWSFYLACFSFLRLHEFHSVLVAFLPFPSPGLNGAKVQDPLVRALVVRARHFKNRTAKEIELVRVIPLLFTRPYA